MKKMDIPYYSILLNGKEKHLFFKMAQTLNGSIDGKISSK